MGNFKGTAGRWKVKHSESKSSVNVINTSPGDKYKIARCPYVLTVNCQDFNDREKQEATANALLISKAPEMLQMLQKISDFIDDNENINYKIRLLSREVPNIKELINSATEM